MNVVRIWFRKGGTAKYMSHLDLIRVMGRVFHRSGVPIWYTEGFNPRPFMTFALPLSLGVTGLRESLDVKMEAEMPFAEIISRLNACMPEGIQVFDAAEPVMKPGEIGFASYTLLLSCAQCDKEALLSAVQSQMNQPELIVEKRSKKGTQPFDLKTAVQEYDLSSTKTDVKMEITLPAGGALNVNPSLFVEAFCRNTALEMDVEITRKGLYNQEMAPFC